jgi:RimJ/RimL family protein N-acetyltransferase
VSLTLLTDRLVVREFRAGDAAALARAFADPEVIWWDPAPFTPDKARAWIDTARDAYARSGFGLYAVELPDAGCLIGDCGLVARTVDGQHLVEIGWHLGRAVWGRGYATEAASAVLAHAAGIGLRRVHSLIAPGNARSRRVAERLGMTVDRQVEWGGRQHGLWVLDLPVLP